MSLFSLLSRRTTNERIADALEKIATAPRAIARDLATMKYRQRVVKSKKIYSRKGRRRWK